MTIAFMNIGAPELIIIFIGLAFVIGIGNYGKDTALGYWGSVLLALFATPLVAFVVISFLRYKKAHS